MITLEIVFQWIGGRTYSPNSEKMEVTKPTSIRAKGTGCRVKYPQSGTEIQII